MAKKNDALTDRQIAFVDHFLMTLNATEAAKRAGYAEKSARTTASDLLTKPNIISAIEERRKSKELELQIDKAKVLTEIAAIAFSDYTDFCSFEDGQVVMKDIDALPRHMRKCIKKITFRTTKQPGAKSSRSSQIGKDPKDVADERMDDGVEITHTTIELHDKIKALEFLGKYFGMFDGDDDPSKKDDKRTNAVSILDVARRIAEGARVRGEDS